MSNSHELAPAVERGKWFDRVELLATTAATYALAATLGYEMSAEASDISTGEMPQPRDLVVFGATAIGLVLFATWRHVHRKTMREISARSQ